VSGYPFRITVGSFNSDFTLPGSGYALRAGGIGIVKSPWRRVDSGVLSRLWRGHRCAFRRLKRAACHLLEILIPARQTAFILGVASLIEGVVLSGVG